MEVLGKIQKGVKKISITKLIFSIIFSISLFFMNKIVFLTYVSDDNYIEKIFFVEFAWIFLLIPIVYILVSLFEKFYDKMTSNFIEKEEIKNKRKICIISFIGIFLIFLLYYLTFYPGGVYIDTWTSLKMLTGEEAFTNQQPVFYTLCLNIVKACLPNLYAGFGIFTFIQILCMAGTLTYFIYWLLKRKVNSKVIAIVVLFFMLFKLYPLYSVSIWKDTPFSLVLFIYTLITFNVADDFKNKRIGVKNIVFYNIFALLVSLFRSNGKYIVIGTLFILFILNIKKFRKENYVSNIKKFFVISLIIVVLCFGIEKIYVMCGIEETPFVENLAIPLQQISRVVAVDGNITDEQYEQINKIMPVEEIKVKYRATIVDKIKWDDTFNEDYINENKLEFFKLWFELFLQNPSEYLSAWLLETSGFWSLNVNGEEAYASPIMWETLNNELQNQDLVLRYTNFDFRDNLLSYAHYSGGLFFWITILSMTFTLRKGKLKDLIGYIPSILLWVTVMISAPMAQSLRYVYILVLILPLNIIYPKIVESRENK